MGPRRHRPWVRAAAVAAGLCLAAMAGFHGLGRLDAPVYDLLARLDPPAASPQVVIVAIDETSLAQMGRWPWSRDRQADLIERIAAQQPAAVGLDLLLSEPAADAGQDAQMAAALRRSGNVVLPVFTARREEGEVVPMVPVEPLASAARALGHVSVEADDDGVVRSVFLQEGTGGRQWEHFALALLRAGGFAVPEPLPGQRAPQAAREPAAGRWWRDHWMLVSYAGPAETYRTISAAQLLSGQLADDALRGRIVLVGSTATGLGDVYPTPLSVRHRFTPGVEISANVAGNLLSGVTRQALAPWHTALLTLALVALGLPALWRWPPLRSAMASLAGIGICLLVSGVLLAGAGRWFAPGAAMVSIAAFYVAWNWRRLEHAAAYLVDELARMRRHGGGSGQAPEPVRKAGGDLIDRRIDDLAAATERLRDVQAFMSSVIESLPDVAVAVGEDGRVRLANQAAQRYFGHALAGTAQMKNLLAGLDAAAGGGMDWPPAFRPGQPVECRDAAGRCFLFEYARCSGLEGIEAAWIATLVDITPLREAERRRDQALRFLSHDIRSPQGAILALLDLYQDDPAEMPQQELLARIRRYAQRTQALAESFVELARLANTPLRREPLDGVDVVLDASDECWSRAQAKRITLETRVPDGECLLEGDRALLTRALINLIGNAVKFSPSGSRIDCRLTRMDGQWCFAVRDQGRGIAAGDLARLFREFSRVGRHDAGDEPGFGMGLAFSKAVAERHGGRIECDSELGRGSEFRILLPASGGHAMQA
ncbi:Alkaline phosphatase synthesis sensor protein PhoR [Pigmentiphaga humi]|uniref:histidine kinase n=1 Tax=Pigmentiphaga humi TaxID=2478468 RepID=A0A3P4B053_9BURK|nr:CHASE2 domain-containing protein [Pigmentiphaga humi]VCU69674.1 Alkaline phosphatase synthesis sensor protein PhoR [Pigmentiphaga humi]